MKNPDEYLFHAKKLVNRMSTLKQNLYTLNPEFFTQTVNWRRFTNHLVRTFIAEYIIAITQNKEE